VIEMYLVVIVAFLAGIMILFRWRVSEFKGEEPFDSYLNQLKDNGTLLENVFLENQTIVRYLYISKAGLYNIYYNPEVLGRIYGDDEETTWKQVLEHRKLPIPNPVRLMEKQHREFERVFNELEVDVPIHEMICLSKRATPKLTISVPVVFLDDIVDMVNVKEEVLSIDEVNRLVTYFESINK